MVLTALTECHWNRCPTGCLPAVRSWAVASEMPVYTQG